MRRLTLATAGFLTALAAPAFAADPMAVPMTEPGFDWTGYYAGLQAGYGWGQSDITGTDGGPFSVTPDINGGFVGGHVAGLWQFDQAVIGAEADLNYASINGTAELAPGNTFGTDIKWFGSVNAKAGYAMDRVLVYGIGGVAFAGAHDAVERDVLAREGLLHAEHVGGVPADRGERHAREHVLEGDHLVVGRPQVLLEEGLLRVTVRVRIVRGVRYGVSDGTGRKTIWSSMYEPAPTSPLTRFALRPSRSAGVSTWRARIRSRKPGAKRSICCSIRSTCGSAGSHAASCGPCV